MTYQSLLVKNNLTGFVFSISIHLIFILLLVVVNTKAEIKLIETPSVLTLSMFKESPVKVPKIFGTMASKPVGIKNRNRGEVKENYMNHINKGGLKIKSELIQNKKQLKAKYLKYKKPDALFSQKQIKDIERILKPSLGTLGRSPQKEEKHTPIRTISKQEAAHSNPKPFAVFHKQRSLPNQPIATTNRQVDKLTTSPQSTSLKFEALYKVDLQKIIATSKIYPPRAKRRGDEGLVKVAFVVSANGMINQVKIVQSSGSKILDKAVIETLKGISGKLPFPKEIQKEYWSFILPVRYQLNEH